MERTTRALAGVGLIGVGVAVAAGWWWPSTAEATDEFREPVRIVEIDNDSGSVTVRAAEVATTTVRQTFRYSWGDHGDGTSLEGGTLRLDDCGWQCSVDYEVVVPLGTTVRGKVNSGNLDLDGVAEVAVEVDSGNVTVRNVEGPVKANADSGDVVLRLAVPGSVTASADSGNVELIVPPASYRVTGDTDSGDRTITVPQDPTSEFVLDLESDSGDVTVRTP